MNENFLNGAASNISVENVSKETVTDHQHENLALKQQLESMQKFITVLIHDIKGPALAFGTLLDMTIDEIENGEFDIEYFKRQLKEMQISNNDTISLIEDLSAWNRNILNKIDLNIMVMQLKDPIDKQISRLSSVAKLKNIKIINEVDEEINAIADFNVLDTVIKNLISNSIKFTNNNGEILISSKNEEDAVLLFIKDNGVGIKEDIKKDLFIKLGVTSLGTSGEKGTGLGLQICRELLEKINGTVDIQSEGENKGTTVTIRLPIGK